MRYTLPVILLAAGVASYLYAHKTALNEQGGAMVNIDPKWGPFTRAQWGDFALIIGGVWLLWNVTKG